MPVSLKGLYCVPQQSTIRPSRINTHVPQVSAPGRGYAQGYPLRLWITGLDLARSGGLMVLASAETPADPSKSSVRGPFLALAVPHVSTNVPQGSTIGIPSRNCPHGRFVLCCGRPPGGWRGLLPSGKGQGPGERRKWRWKPGRGETGGLGCLARCAARHSRFSRTRKFPGLGWWLVPHLSTKNGSRSPRRRSYPGFPFHCFRNP